ncbi:hypothetical protein K474DRAFT_1631279 [Panus rudis PR-1116 ss-1]|nr:hypothetical protein K474DRAFT_1631279 [Panus rudis PR-1116 ss-1]
MRAASLRVVGSESPGASDTSQAQQAIASKAASTAQDGPWSITKEIVKPPSGDIHDFLSWAPYHWPDPNLCGQNDTIDYPDSGYPDSVGGDDGTDGHDSNIEKRYLTPPSKFLPRGRHNVRVAHRHHRSHSQGVKRLNIDNLKSAKRDLSGLPLSVVDGSTVKPGIPVQPQSSVDPSQTMQLESAATGSRAEAGTYCPYVLRDGIKNPDVDLLVGPDYANKMSQSVLYNALSYALFESPNNSQNVANFIDTYFLSPATAMNSNMNFAQLVRGSGNLKDGEQKGTFTGPRDMRGMVKVVNALMVMKATKSPDWTAEREQAMSTWAKEYLSWLQTSDIGKELAGKPNNYLTSYVNQVAALQMYLGDNEGALSTIRTYFENQFQDQIAQNGEQPFEAVRARPDRTVSRRAQNDYQPLLRVTRPIRERAFNLEAMITNAKIADQLGENLWDTESRYGATIQTALDYAMSLDLADEPEAVSDLMPHVASVAAAYGDPSGKYKEFMQRHQGDYQSEPWWFYDQTAALPNSPAAGSNRKRDDGVEEAHNSTEAGPGKETVPFECPAVFAGTTEVELEDGLWVSCEDMRLLYDIPLL